MQTIDRFDINVFKKDMECRNPFCYLCEEEIKDNLAINFGDDWYHTECFLDKYTEEL